MVNLLDSAKKYLQVATEQKPLHTMTPHEVRRLRANAPKVPPQNSVPLHSTKDCQIPVRDGEQILARIYTPEGNGPFPMIVYYHGGGWVLNDIDTCDASCRLLAVLTNSIVISVGYRLAPEYKFPIPVYDAYDAFIWTSANSYNLNGLKNRITVMGDSAGGNLATVVTLLNKELNGPEIFSQILLYPVTDLSFSTNSYNEYSTGYGLEKKDMQWFARYYLNDASELTNPLAAPYKAENLSHLPAACVIVAENDVLKDEGIAYGEKLKQFGNQAELHTAKGLIHSYFTKNELFNMEIEKTIAIIRNFLSNNQQ